MPGLPQFDDLGYLNNPQRVFLQTAYLHGQFPFWNPLNYGGQPFFSAGQSGPLYLPNLIFLFLPANWFIKLSFLFHLELIVLGMYGLTFHLVHSKRGAILSSLAFATCGFFIGHQIHTQMFDAFAWLPLLFWLSLRLFENTSLYNVLLVSLVYAGVLYAGHPQMAFDNALFVCLYLSIIVLIQRKWRGLIVVLLSFLLGLGLAAPQWYPTLKLIAYSNRDFAPGFLLSGSMSLRDFLQFVFPFVTNGFFGSPRLDIFAYQTAYHDTWFFWEYGCFIGAIPLSLALSALFVKKHLPIRVLTALLVFFVLLSSAWNVTHFILVHTPGFDLFRIPARYMGLVDFILCVLVAYAVKEIEEGYKRFQLIAVIGISLALLTVTDTAYVIKLLPISLLSLYVAIIPQVMFLLSLFIMRWNRIVFLNIVFTMSALFQVTYALSINRFLTEYPLPNMQPLVSYLQTHLSKPYPFFRFLDLSDAMYADENLFYNLPTVTGYDSLVSRYTNSASNLNQSTLDEMDVEYIISSPDHPVPSDLKSHWASVFTYERYTVWRNDDVLHPTNLPNARLAQYKFNRQTWHVTAKQDQSFVISQVYDPGWHAYIDGTATAVETVNGFMTAVPVSKGTHTITLTYTPYGMTTGITLSIVSAMAFLTVALLVQLHIKKATRKTTLPTPQLAPSGE